LAVAGLLALAACIDAPRAEGSEGPAGGSGAGGGDGGAAVWRPPPGTTWQWQLQGTIDTSLDVAMYDVDLFDVPQATLEGLQGAGRVVICYFSAGSYEDWRDDAGEFEAADLGDPLGEWPGEYWLDIRSEDVRRIMADRLDLAASKGCDGVEPDNVDGYQNANGLGLSSDDQLDYNAWLADEAHARGLSIGLKNALGLIEALEPLFDWALNEECFDYDECDMNAPFLSAGKAVFHTEYVDRESEGDAAATRICDAPEIEQHSTLIKTWDLTTWGLACWD